MKEFGALAITGPGYAISAEERAERSLAGTLPAHIPALSVGKINNVSKARIRRAFSELAQGNVENVEQWLHAVAAGVMGTNGSWITKPDPRAAIELYMALAEFTIPKVKAIAIDVNDGKSTKRYSMAELQSIVSEQ